MTIRAISTFALALAIAAPVSVAQAATIDFNSEATNYGTPISAGGFDFSFTAAGWGLIGPSSGACCNVNYNGTNSIFADGDRNGGTANIVMTATGGGTFSVFGLDAAVFYNGAPNETLTLIGHLFGGGTVVTSINTSTAWTRFNLTGFQNLTRLAFVANTAGDFGVAPGMGIDNIDLAGRVPEPASWAMMIAGFGLAGAGLRRRATKVSYA